MKIVLSFVLLICTLAGYSQGPPKKGPTQSKATKVDTSQNSPLVLNDTLSQRKDTIKVKYYLDVDSAGYVSVNKGYLVKTHTFSTKIEQLRSEQSILYDEAWRRIDGNLVMNVREFRW